ncbi:N-acetylmuramoyl-L-alanine amidase [Promicromonospora sp. AC04]|uniref:golvesin C-terminal-like domain-containing protein n=1 Tax=Promicromonospora sp. AC04 TaxID=2135723 RepID=UPI000D390E32|nr:N-acetylmuramoyl-L-alanine amidase [Promicromonospora sp. AC04]PUB28872.1 N-acetylmuramoyl-L-alanine amidase [Promicromonospora sp. AC04]
MHDHDHSSADHSPDSHSSLGRRDLLRSAVVLGIGAAGATIAAPAVAAPAVTGPVGAAPARAGDAPPSLAPDPEAPADAPPGALAGVDVVTPTIASCNTWGAEAARGTIDTVSTNPNKILIHHTASANVTDYSQAAGYQIARDIQQWHFANGWVDTGQHLTVSRGGYVMEGRHGSLSRLQNGSGMVVGAHAPGQNSQAIGIENQGTYTSATPPAQLWSRLVELCAYICDQYGIAPTQIYGHRDYTATACPGDVLYSMLPQLRSEVAAALAGTSWSVIVDNTSAGFSAGGSWLTSSFSAERYGANYHYATPAEVSDLATYSATIPSNGSYRVEAWFPGIAGYNTSTPFIVYTGTGSSTIRVDQSTGGGAWLSLGTYAMTAGTRNVVAVSRWTTGTAYVVADAIRLTRL